MEFIYSRKLIKAKSAASALFVILFSGCNTPPSIEETVAALKNMQPAISDKPLIENTQSNNSVPADSRNVPLDSVSYWKMLRDSCPELFRKDALGPYEAFDKCKSLEMRGYNSELGIDQYFKRYARVLRTRSGKAMVPLRKATLESMQLLYFIANNLSGGGTFYSHMLARSEGEIEYRLYKFEKGEMDFSTFDFKKNQDALFRKWKKNIRKSIAKNSGNRVSGVSNPDIENQLLDSLSRMASLIETPFTLTYVDEFCHRFYSDLDF
jgi:hypothetical protein